jgi:hypothetical protein
MRCPYCDFDMEPGILQSSNDIFWSKQERRFPVMPDIIDGDIIVAEGLYRSSNDKAFLCRNCKRLVVELQFIEPPFEFDE